MGDAAGTVEVPDRYELRSTVGPYQLGSRDRCVRFEGAAVFWRATRTPEGPATGRYRHAESGVVEVEAWGPGSAWLITNAGVLLGVDDDITGFADLVAEHPLLHRLHRARAGLRIGRSQAVFEALVPTICSQKVTGLEAKRAWSGIVDRWGEPAPGPGGLRLPPEPAALGSIGYQALHPLGVERKRAEVIRAVAKVAARLEAVASMVPAAAEAALRSVPGVGVWSAAEVRRVALGDADAVSYGDYHVPHIVSWNLLGQRRGSDDLMAELLAPFAPHRGRVVRLLEVAGHARPRRGPRMAPSAMRSR